MNSPSSVYRNSCKKNPVLTLCAFLLSTSCARHPGRRNVYSKDSCRDVDYDEADTPPLPFLLFSGPALRGLQPRWQILRTGYMYLKKKPDTYVSVCIWNEK